MPLLEFPPYYDDNGNPVAIPQGSLVFGGWTDQTITGASLTRDCTAVTAPEVLIDTGHWLSKVFTVTAGVHVLTLTTAAGDTPFLFTVANISEAVAPTISLPGEGKTLKAKHVVCVGKSDTPLEYVRLTVGAGAPVDGTIVHQEMKTRFVVRWKLDSYTNSDAVITVKAEDFAAATRNFKLKVP